MERAGYDMLLGHAVLVSLSGGVNGGCLLVF